jgi:hypothetical protein
MLTQKSDMHTVECKSSKVISAVVGLVLVLLAGCGSAALERDSRVNSDFQKTYGMRYDVPLSCGGVSAEQSLEIVLESARRLSDFCEHQNVKAAAAGYVRCPVGLCQQEYKPGSLAAPTLKFSVNNGTSMSSMFGGYGGSSGGSSGSSDSVFGKRIYVSLEFNIPLAKSPDELSCVNPLNSTVQTTILNEIGKAALASKNEPCLPPQ